MPGFTNRPIIYPYWWEFKVRLEVTAPRRIELKISQYMILFSLIQIHLFPFGTDAPFLSYVFSKLPIIVHSPTPDRLEIFTIILCSFHRWFKLTYSNVGLKHRFFPMIFQSFRYDCRHATRVGLTSDLLFIMSLAKI